MTTNIIYCENSIIISVDTNYQGFIYDINRNMCIPKNHRVIPKWKVVSETFPNLVKGKTFMDLGANMGFFCFKALEFGSTKVYGIEAHKPYYESTLKVIKDIDKIDWVYGYFPDIVLKKGIKADVVMCMSLVHHLFSRYSLEEIIIDLYNTANKCVVIEWIGEDDAQVLKYGYSSKEGYSRRLFEKNIQKYFSEMEFIGVGHHSTRFVYVLDK